jgi:hypothetical protein
MGISIALMKTGAPFADLCDFASIAQARPGSPILGPRLWRLQAVELAEAFDGVTGAPASW